MSSPRYYVNERVYVRGTAEKHTGLGKIIEISGYGDECEIAIIMDSRRRTAGKGPKITQLARTTGEDVEQLVIVHPATITKDMECGLCSGIKPVRHLAGFANCAHIICLECLLCLIDRRLPAAIPLLAACQRVARRHFRNSGINFARTKSTHIILAALYAMALLKRTKDIDASFAEAETALSESQLHCSACGVQRYGCGHTSFEYVLGVLEREGYEIKACYEGLKVEFPDRFNSYGYFNTDNPDNNEDINSIIAMPEHIAVVTPIVTVGDLEVKVPLEKDDMIRQVMDRGYNEEQTRNVFVVASSVKEALKLLETQAVRPDVIVEDHLLHHEPVNSRDRYDLRSNDRLPPVDKPNRDVDADKSYSVKSDNRVSNSDDALSQEFSNYKYLNYSTTASKPNRDSPASDVYSNANPLRINVLSMTADVYDIVKISIPNRNSAQVATDEIVDRLYGPVHTDESFYLMGQAPDDQPLYRSLWEPVDGVLQLAPDRLYQVRGLRHNISPRKPMRILAKEFSFNETIRARVQELSKSGFIAFRQARGDGNCYYRAAMFSMIEHEILRLNPSGDAVKKPAIIRQDDTLEPETMPPAVNWDPRSTLFYRMYKRIEESNTSGIDSPVLSVAIDKLRQASQGCCWRTVAEFELDILNVASNVDEGLILGARKLISKFMRDHEDMEFDGLRLRDSAMVHDYEGFCRNVIERMGEDAEGSFVNYGVLFITLQTRGRLMFLDRDEEATLQAVISYDWKRMAEYNDFDGCQDANEFSCNLLFKRGHYDIIYPNQL